MKQNRKSLAGHCLARPQTCQTETDIQLKSTKRQRFGVTCPLLMQCAKQKLIMLLGLWLDLQLSKATLVCHMEIRELPSGKKTSAYVVNTLGKSL